MATIGVAVATPEEAEVVQILLESFASAHALHRYRHSEDENVRKLARQDPSWYRFWNETRYNPNPPKVKCGFTLILREHSEQCLVIDLEERSGIWAQESLNAFSELVDQLNQAIGPDVHVLVRPKKEQNWTERQRHPGYVDPERATSAGEFCLRMGLPDPYAARTAVPP